MALTATACNNAKAREKAYKLADSQGLYLHVMPSGAKYWRLKYRFQAKEKLLALGVFPEVSLAAARERKSEARKLLGSGADPALARLQKRHTAALDAQNTFEAVAREWHENNNTRWTEAYGVNLLHRLTRDIFPSIGALPIKSVTAPQLLDVLKKVQKRRAIEVAHRLLQTCGQIFRYAIATGAAERNPAPDLKGALKPMTHVHFAALDAKHLPEFLHALEHNDARLFPQTRHALKLMMYTFVRTGELINAKWDEFDLEGKQWNIPAERMKMRRPHIVPLSRQALEVLKVQHDLTGKWDYVFPNQVRPRKAMSNNTILKALERLGYKGRMTGHGFRALAMSTIKEKLEYRHEVVDRQLAHGHRNEVDAAYDRATFLPERKRMMQDWANYLDAAASQGRVVVGKFGKT